MKVSSPLGKNYWDTERDLVKFTVSMFLNTHRYGNFLTANSVSDEKQTLLKREEKD